MATLYKRLQVLTNLHEGNPANALSELERLADLEEADGLSGAAVNSHLWSATAASITAVVDGIAQHFADAWRLGATEAALGTGAALDYGRHGRAVEARKGLEATPGRPTRPGPIPAGTS